MRTTLKNTLLAGLIAVSMGACAPTPSAEQAKSSSNLSEPSLEQYVAASFDDIYNGTYHTYSVMYEGIPSAFEYEHLESGDYPLLTLFFEDEQGARKITAYCESGCSYGSYFYPTNIALGQIKEALSEKLPLRVYGIQDGPTIKISSLAYLIGPGRWQDVRLTNNSVIQYTTPEPSTSTSSTPQPSGGQ
jgi:hypothetical protein